MRATHGCVHMGKTENQKAVAEGATISNIQKYRKRKPAANRLNCMQKYSTSTSQSFVFQIDFCCPILSPNLSERHFHFSYFLQL